MSTEVIILAQGTQQRLGNHTGFKQLLPLPACNGVPILCRTVRQVFHLNNRWIPNIVTWSMLRAGLSWPTQAGMVRVDPGYTTLEHPGNSSLKGIARYLELRDARLRDWRERQSDTDQRYPDSTIVLLGDVVYSWACLEALRALAMSWGFVGTANLSGSTGELWGVAWSRAYTDRMMSSLRDALLRHPPFEDNYQPGQMRRWITGWDRGDLRDHVAKHRRVGAYIDIDDYTNDIDIPTDLVLLPDLSQAAVADDAAHGVTWAGVETHCREVPL